MHNEPNRQNPIDRQKSLHSRYNPQAEAERYVASHSLDENIRFFILVEPGLGYITGILKKKFPEAKIIALHIEKPADELTVSAPDSQWYPETGILVQDFLEAEIPDLKASEIRLLEWRPAMSLYGEAYLTLVKEAVEFIKRSDANTRTLGTFGRRWFRNFFKNLDIIRQILCPLPISMPVLVTGAGPGLEDLIPLIREKRDTYFILAASSSVATLENENINPNLIITTDGTAWAKFHLYSHFRAKQSSIAAALTAALPSQCSSFPVMPISDGSLWQTLILNELKIPYITLPQRGTVSASALDLAFALSDSEVFIAGIDLANRDIRSHARPYSLDSLMEEHAERTNPLYSQVFKRSSLLKEGGSYGIYASWFKKQLSLYPKRLYSLGKNNPVFSSVPTKAETVTAKKNKPESIPGTEAKCKTITLAGAYSLKAHAVLEKAFKNPVHSEALEKELKLLLFQDKKISGTEELIENLAVLRNAGNDAGK